MEITDVIKCQRKFTLETYDYGLLLFTSNVQRHDSPIAFRYGGSNSLIQIAVDPVSQEVRYLEVVSVNKISRKIPEISCSVSIGTPKILIPDHSELQGPEGLKRVDSDNEFSIFMGKNTLQIEIFANTSCSSIIRCGNLDFLISNSRIIGFRLSNISTNNLENFYNYYMG